MGEMGADTGAEVWLDRALKYSGLSCTEIWISEAQERMVLAVPEHNWQQFHDLCAAEGVEATAIGRFTETHQLVLKYGEHQVGSLSMEFLHDGRPPVIREAVYETQAEQSLPAGSEEALGQSDFTNELRHSGFPECGQQGMDYSAVRPRGPGRQCDQATDGGAV